MRGGALRTGTEIARSCRLDGRRPSASSLSSTSLRLRRQAVRISLRSTTCRVQASARHSFSHSSRRTCTGPRSLSLSLSAMAMSSSSPILVLQERIPAESPEGTSPSRPHLIAHEKKLSSAQLALISSRDERAASFFETTQQAGVAVFSLESQRAREKHSKVLPGTSSREHPLAHTRGYTILARIKVSMYSRPPTSPLSRA